MNMNHEISLRRIEVNHFFHRTSASPMAHLTEITGTKDREQLVNVINRLRPGGSTNLVAGLKKGLDVS